MTNSICLIVECGESMLGHLYVLQSHASVGESKQLLRNSKDVLQIHTISFLVTNFCSICFHRISSLPPRKGLSAFRNCLSITFSDGKKYEDLLIVSGSFCLLKILWKLCLTSYTPWASRPI